MNKDHAIPVCPPKEELLTLWEECFRETQKEFSPGNIKSQGRFFQVVEYYLRDYNERFHVILHPEKGTAEYKRGAPEKPADLYLEMDADIFHRINLERLSPIAAQIQRRIIIKWNGDFEFIRILRYLYLFKPLFREYRNRLKFYGITY